MNMSLFFPKWQVSDPFLKESEKSLQCQSCTQRYHLVSFYILDSISPKTYHNYFAMKRLDTMKDKNEIDDNTTGP